MKRTVSGVSPVTVCLVPAWAYILVILRNGYLEVRFGWRIFDLEMQTFCGCQALVSRGKSPFMSNFLPKRPTFHDTAALVRVRLAERGFDLCVPFDVHAYNHDAPDGFALPTFGRVSVAGLLVGNHRGLWDVFMRHFRASKELQSDVDPLDRYTEEAVEWALKNAVQKREVRFGHKASPCPVAMQHLAQVAGFAELTESHLSVHPTYGPWIALRAAVVIDQEVQIETPDLERVCDNACRVRCKTAFEEALAQTEGEGHEGIAASSDAWLAVRDACATGREFRYSAAQIGYHYTHDRKYLAGDSG